MKKILKSIIVSFIVLGSVAPTFGALSIGGWLGYNAALSDALVQINDPNETNGGFSAGLELWLGLGPISLGASASYLETYSYEDKDINYATNGNSTKVSLGYIPTLLRARLTIGNWFIGAGTGYAFANASFEICVQKKCSGTSATSANSAASSMGEIGYGADIDEDMGYEFFFRINEIFDNQSITNFTGGVALYFNM